MNKAAYLKTVEVIIAAILLLGVFVHINEEVLSREGEIEKPSRLRELSETLISTYYFNGILDETVGKFRVSEFQELLYYTLPTNIESSLEVTYLEKVKVTNKKEGKGRNLSLSYNFPKFVDKGSVKIYKGNEELPIKPIFRWYRIPINFRSNLSESKHCKVSVKNITLEVEEGEPKQSSVIFYIGRSRGRVDVENLEKVGEGKAKANLTLDLGRMKPRSLREGYIYFTSNESKYERGPTNLEENTKLEKYLSEREKAPRADLLFKANLSPGKDTQLRIEYKTGTNEESSWEEIKNPNRNKVEYTYEDRLKKGNMKPNPSKTNQESVKVSKRFENYILTLNLWYYG